MSFFCMQCFYPACMREDKAIGSACCCLLAQKLLDFDISAFEQCVSTTKQSKTVKNSLVFTVLYKQYTVHFHVVTPVHAGLILRHTQGSAQENLSGACTIAKVLSNCIK